MIRMIHVVLIEPEIPPNTGNIIRLCANTGATLHLVRPLGFPLDDARMRRAGLDYHEYATMLVHDDWAACKLERDTTGGIKLSKGLGTRLVAAAAISKHTKAIAVCVSQSSGTVRLFQNGEQVLHIEPFKRPLTFGRVMTDSANGVAPMSRPLAEAYTPVARRGRRPSTAKHSRALRGPSRRCHGDPGGRHRPAGQAGSHCEAPRFRRNPRRDVGHLFRQDRHPHPQPDDCPVASRPRATL